MGSEISIELEAFEALSTGELYHLATPETVEVGLEYYNNEAVDSLSWKERTRRIYGVVKGRRAEPYETWLKIRREKLVHGCDCIDWAEHKQCKHVVAMAASVFYALQDKNIGGVEMRESYQRKLRQDLGYPVEEGAGEGHSAGTKNKEEATLLLSMNPGNGYAQFRILDTVPTDYLDAIGITLGNSYYGYGLAREFYFGSPEKNLPGMLRKAKRHGVKLCVDVDGKRQPLTIGGEVYQMQIVLDHSGDMVESRLRIYDEAENLVDVFGMVPESYYMICRDGVLRKASHNPAYSHFMILPPTEGDDFDLFLKSSEIEAKDFNESSMLCDFDPAWIEEGHLILETRGKQKKINQLSAEKVRMGVDITLTEGSVDEDIRIDFKISQGKRTLDIRAIVEEILDPVLQSPGTLLDSKERVRSLMELIRQFIAAAPEERGDMEKTYKVTYPVFNDEDYLARVDAMLRRIKRLLKRNDGILNALAADDRGGWCVYPVNVERVAMLVFSISSPETKAELDDLGLGVISPLKGQAQLLRRAALVCKAIDVDLLVDHEKVKTASVSIEVNGEAVGEDIDWFELHPSIRCGDRDLSLDEWRQLISGELVLRDEDGSYVLPDISTEGQDGLRLLANILERESGPQGSRRGKRQGDAYQVSRLEMLDWIALRKCGVDVTLPKETDRLFQSLMSFDGIDAFKKPKTLKAKLRQYQSEGCAWIDFHYQHRFGACLADDMGLGKTIQSIGFIANRIAERKVAPEIAPVLVVVPPSLVFNWLDEFERFCPSIRVEAALANGSFDEAARRTDVLLTTYDRVRLEVEEMEQYKFDIIVFDEAHNLKNVTTARTKAAARLNRRFTLCLTGTPVENNVGEFYSVMSAAVPGIFGTMEEFRLAYRKQPDQILGRAKPFILRRTKEKILKELPPKQEHELFLDMSDLQKEIYARTVSEVRAEVAAAYESRPDQQAGIIALSAILRLRQVCVSPELMGKSINEHAPKFQYMAEKLEELQAEGHAGLVFSQFRGGLDQMEAVAKEAGLSYLRMDGSTPVAKRKQIVADFQDENGPSFFFISLKTGGVGLNLTRANYVFHLDPWWNPSVENQASDRAHRIGQTRSVFIQRLIMRHTIEERMLDLKARKAELFRRLIDEPGTKSAATGLSRSDFEYLIDM